MTRMPNQQLASSVVAEIRAEMARQRISQRTLAAKLGWSQPGLSRRLNADPAPRIDEIERIALALGVPVARFLATGNGSV